MTTQPITKRPRAFDWLCWVLVLFGFLCLVASVPQTFTMVRVAHDKVGAAVLVIVLEVMAFFALLAPLWVPSWTRTFDRIAFTLLAITTIGNYAGGWNYVWANEELEPFWKNIRDWRLLDWPIATIVLVGVLAGLVPFAMKFFIGLAIKRYRENEIEHTPDAVAQRLVEPMEVQILATRKLQEHLLEASGTFSNPLVLPSAVTGLSNGSGYDSQALLEENGDLRERLANLLDANEKLQIDAARMDSLQEELAEKSRLLAERYTIPEPERKYADYAAVPAHFENEYQEPWTLDALLKQAGYTREQVLGQLKSFGIKNARAAYSGLSRFGKLPEGMTFEEFEPLYNELMAGQKASKPAPVVTAAKKSETGKQFCERCGRNELTPSDLGVAARSKTKQKLCGECRSNK